MLLRCRGFEQCITIDDRTILKHYSIPFYKAVKAAVMTYLNDELLCDVTMVVSVDIWFMLVAASVVDKCTYEFSKSLRYFIYITQLTSGCC